MAWHEENDLELNDLHTAVQMSEDRVGIHNEKTDCVLIVLTYISSLVL